MTIAKIIAPMTGAKRDTAVLATAFAAAKPFNAHVVALLVHPDPRLTVPAMGAPIAPQIVQNIVDAAEELNRVAAKAVRAALAQAAAAAGALIVEQPERAQAVTCSYRETDGFFGDTVARAARLSDLVVFGPVATSDGPDVNDCFVEILTRTDRPLLLAAGVPRNLTGKIAIAWDGSATASHAVLAAMPFLTRAESVTILHVGHGKSEDAGSSFLRKTGLHELREYLALRGIAGNEQIFERGAKTTGEALLEAAVEHRVELLVMGGYGHSHLRETMFGGVTAHVRWHAELPVLMVH